MVFYDAYIDKKQHNSIYQFIFLWYSNYVKLISKHYLKGGGNIHKQERTLNRLIGCQNTNWHMSPILSIMIAYKLFLKKT